jgi:hypothetical protein
MVDAFADFIFDDIDTPDLPWFIERKDRDPADEFARQAKFVNKMKSQPGVDVFAVPNANTGSDWQKVRRFNEGARKGVLDLVITWKPSGQGDRGVAFAEFKDGQKMPFREQRDRLNRYFREGHNTGVFRTAETLIAWLIERGCPIKPSLSGVMRERLL